MPDWGDIAAVAVLAVGAVLALAALVAAQIAWTNRRRYRSWPKP